MGQAYVSNRQSVVSEKFDDDTVLINFVTGAYFSLRGTAPYIWNALETPTTIERVAALLSADPATQEAVRATIETLVAEGCVLPVEVHESELHNRAGEQPWSGAYTPPIVEVFHDLQELITIDPVHEVDDSDGWPRRRSVRN
jgi:hypothetical protein